MSRAYRTLEERETIIIFNEKDSTAHIETYNGRLLRRLDKVCASTPLFSVVQREERRGEYTFPKRYLHIGQPRSKASPLASECKSEREDEDK